MNREYQIQNAIDADWDELKDKNLHTLLQVKAYGTLNAAEGIDQTEGARAIADHICDLLNREYLPKQ